MVSATSKLTEFESLLNARKDCQGCAGAASVVYEEIPLCGSCFYIASLTSLRRLTRFDSNDSSGTVADTATIISSLVQLFRNGFRPVADPHAGEEDDDR